MPFFLRFFCGKSSDLFPLKSTNQENPYFLVPLQYTGHDHAKDQITQGSGLYSVVCRHSRQPRPSFSLLRLSSCWPNVVTMCVRWSLGSEDKALMNFPPKVVYPTEETSFCQSARGLILVQRTHYPCVRNIAESFLTSTSIPNPCIMPYYPIGGFFENPSVEFPLHTFHFLVVPLSHLPNHVPAKSTV